jgi:hypothetical protein
MRVHRKEESKTMQTDETNQVIKHHCSPLATIVAGLLASGHYTRPKDEDYDGCGTSDDCRLIYSYQEVETHFSPLAVSDAIEILEAIQKWEEQPPDE